MIDTTITVKTACGHNALITLMQRTDGIIAELSSLATPCCTAAATFADDGKGGSELVCKSCYHRVGDAYAFGLESALRVVGCPCPTECAIHTSWTAREQAEAQTGQRL